MLLETPYASSWHSQPHHHRQPRDHWDQSCHSLSSRLSGSFLTTNHSSLRFLTQSPTPPAPQILALGFLEFCPDVGKNPPCSQSLLFLLWWKPVLPWGHHPLPSPTRGCFITHSPGPEGVGPSLLFPSSGLAPKILSPWNSSQPSLPWLPLASILCLPGIPPTRSLRRLPLATSLLSATSVVLCEISQAGRESSQYLASPPRSASPYKSCIIACLILKPHSINQPHQVWGRGLSRVVTGREGRGWDWGPWPLPTPQGWMEGELCASTGPGTSGSAGGMQGPKKNRTFEGSIWSVAAAKSPVLSSPLQGTEVTVI